MIEVELMKNIVGSMLGVGLIYLIYCSFNWMYKFDRYERDKLSELIYTKKALYSFKLPKPVRILNRLHDIPEEYTLPFITTIYDESDIKKISIEQRDDGYLVKVKEHEQRK
ncbi:MAG: hypothetical protein KAS32_31370 [Candidatus Peribacteraceae bacterium]|nr:hypothetical protein [Candidatus Peribacteraceae bacterium]